MTAGDFDPALTAGLDEPVRRYFRHAIRPGAPLDPAVVLEMTGRIRLGAWLPFTAAERLDGRSFAWTARVAVGRATLLTADDRFAGGQGSTTVRLFGRLPMLRAAGEDVARSGAGRAALEALWSPCALLPERGVEWRAEADEHIVATWSVPPERPEVHFTIAPDGSVMSCWALRRRGGAYRPCGAVVTAERRFGDLVVPSALTVSWDFGTPRQRPFFTAEIGRLARTSGGEP